MFLLIVSGQVDLQILRYVREITSIIWGRSASRFSTLTPRKGNASSGLGLRDVLLTPVDHSLSWTLRIYCLPSVRSVTLGYQKNNSESNKWHQAFELLCLFCYCESAVRENPCVICIALTHLGHIAFVCATRLHTP